ncbi:hypothetical protein OG216_28645 [Streptomycetaceae bacterium NBC_01309]
MSSGTYLPGRGNIVERNQKIGEAKGRAADVVRVLERRGVAVSEADRQRVIECEDLDTLSAWFDRAFDVATADELFAEPPGGS